MRRVIFDLKCDSCTHTVENNFDYPAQESYGTCTECNTGLLKQVIGAITHTFHTPVDSVKGRTTNGMKFEVGSKVRRYHPATGTYSG